jgi:hypothetical protein
MSTLLVPAPSASVTAAVKAVEPKDGLPVTAGVPPASDQKADIPTDAPTKSKAVTRGSTVFHQLPVTTDSTEELGNDVKAALEALSSILDGFQHLFLFLVLFVRVIKRSMLVLMLCLFDSDFRATLNSIWQNAVEKLRSSAEGVWSCFCAFLCALFYVAVSIHVLIFILSLIEESRDGNGVLDLFKAVSRWKASIGKIYSSLSYAALVTWTSLHSEVHSFTRLSQIQKFFYWITTGAE